MNACGNRFRYVAMAILASAACLGLVILGNSYAQEQRPSTDKHVRELARYLDSVKIAEPVVYQHLAVYPILAEDVPRLRGRWLTADAAIARGVLEVSEKGGGSVPLLRVENRSKDEYVFLMTGEVIAGGMQTRTIRHDVVLAPGQMIDLEVFCVEAHRWAGEAKFSGGSKTMLPQSIQGKARGGANQSEIWSEVARNNKALKAENATSSLDQALKSAACAEQTGRSAAENRPRDSTRHHWLHLRGPRPPIGHRVVRQRGPRPPTTTQTARFLYCRLRDPQRGTGPR